MLLSKQQIVLESLRRVKMKYMGSKARIAKHILPIMLAECESMELQHGSNRLSGAEI